MSKAAARAAAEAGEARGADTGEGGDGERGSARICGADDDAGAAADLQRRRGDRKAAGAAGGAESVPRELGGGVWQLERDGGVPGARKPDGRVPREAV